MIQNVYSIYDVKAKEYGPLFLAKNDDIAVRMIKTNLKDILYPQDYELYQVGCFDNESGELIYASLDLVSDLSSIFMPKSSDEESKS